MHKNYWLSEFPTPKSILTDQGRSFISVEFMEFCQALGIHYRNTSGYNPTGNSISERINQTLLNGIRILKGLKFSEVLERVEDAHNNSHHATINYSPFEVIFGFSNLDPCLRKINVDFNALNSRAQNQANLDNQRTNAKRLSHFEYKIGDCCLVKRENLQKGERPFDGPFKILAVKENLVLLKLTDFKNRWFNLKRVKPFLKRE